MVLGYLPTFDRTKSPSHVGKYTIHGAYGYMSYMISSLRPRGRLGKLELCTEKLEVYGWETEGLNRKLEVSSENLEFCWESHMIGKCPKRRHTPAKIIDPCGYSGWIP